MSRQLVKDFKEFPLPVIRVSGTSEERGVQYGIQAKKLIEKSLKVYEKIVAKMRPDTMSREKMLKEVKAFIPTLRRYDRELFREMQGIAKGAELTIEEIVFLNARSEIMNPAWANAQIHEGCTSFILEPSWNQHQEFFVGQTYDWIPECTEQLILYISQNEQGLEMATITEAWILGKLGCNNYGVANLLNYLNNYEINEKGALYNVLLRRVLDSRDFYEAQRNIIRSPIAFGLNLLLTDIQGKSIDYELTANGIDFFNPKNGKLLHTNHYLSDKLSLRTFFKEADQESRLRYETAERFFDKRKGNLTIEDLMDLAAFHGKAEGEGDICRHENTDEYGMETIFALIMELKSKRMYLCVGTPCDHPFYEIELQELFHEMHI